MGRFHTSEGKFVGCGRLPNGLIALWQSAFRKVIGRIPEEPWIPFSACRALESIISQDFVVREIGSGFSTIWMAKRVAKIVSIEANAEWHSRLSSIAATEGLANVDIRLEWQAGRMSDFSELADASIDLLFIDGGPRGSCLRNGFPKVRAGGWIYLDNWDSKHFWEDAGDFLPLRDSLISESKTFIDYVPGQFGVYEGILLRKK